MRGRSGGSFILIEGYDVCMYVHVSLPWLYVLLVYCIGEKMSGAGMGNSLAGLAYYGSNDSDPYITLKKTVSCTFFPFLI